mmetsp:Transcript_43993/g.138269  ORF Transcript_43993/g.138269 Transcript_43993/m.138269 type:complete len:358 (-) Transcript_43993:799-1872(-)
MGAAPPGLAAAHLRAGVAAALGARLARGLPRPGVPARDDAPRRHRAPGGGVVVDLRAGLRPRGHGRRARHVPGAAARTGDQREPARRAPGAVGGARHARARLRHEGLRGAARGDDGVPARGAARLAADLGGMLLHRRYHRLFRPAPARGRREPDGGDVHAAGGPRGVLRQRRGHLRGARHHAEPPWHHRAHGPEPAARRRRAHARRGLRRREPQAYARRGRGPRRAGRAGGRRPARRRHHGAAVHGVRAGAGPVLPPAAAALRAPSADPHELVHADAGDRHGARRLARGGHIMVARLRHRPLRGGLRPRGRQGLRAGRGDVPAHRRVLERHPARVLDAEQRPPARGDGVPGRARHLF